MCNADPFLAPSCVHVARRHAHTHSQIRLCVCTICALIYIYIYIYIYNIILPLSVSIRDLYRSICIFYLHADIFPRIQILFWRVETGKKLPPQNVCELDWATQTCTYAWTNVGLHCVLKRFVYVNCLYEYVYVV